MNRDGSEIEEDKVNSIFRIKGKDEEQLAVNIGQMGTIEPKFVRTPRQEGEKAISIPIETQNIRPTTRETREYMNRSRNTSVDNNIKNIEEHQKENCDEVDARNTNDNPNDDTHNHNFNQEFINECVDRLIEKYGDIYNRNDLINKVVEYKEENGNKDISEEQFYEELDEKVGEEAEQEHPQHQRTE